MNPTFPSPPQRRRPQAREYLRAAVALSVALVTVGVIAARDRSEPSAFAATNAGPAQILNPPGTPVAGQPLTAGTATTAFALVPPTGAACTGDSASDNYRIHSFMVPASVDPNTITYDADGPFPQAFGAALRLPLFSATGTPFVNGITAVKTPSSPGGLLTGLPVLSFEVFLGADVPAGPYLIGYACVLAPPGVAPTLDRWWSAAITVGAGLSWTAGTPTPPTTTTLAPTTSTSTTTTSTTTTVPGSTPTTVGPTTSTSTSTSTTTTTLPASSTSTSTTSTSTTSTSTTTLPPATSTTAPPTGPGATTTTTPGHDAGDHGDDDGDDHHDADDDHDRADDHHGHRGKPRECGRRRYGRGGTDRVGTTCAPRTHSVTPAPPRRGKEHS